MKRRLFTTAGAVLVIALMVAQAGMAHTPPLPEGLDCNEADLFCPATTGGVLTEALAHFPEPAVTAPPPPAPQVQAAHAVTYDVAGRGTLAVDLASFKAQVAQTLADARGWARLGVSFSEVASGGQFTVVLAEASQVPTFAPEVCSSEWSCRVGRYIIINQDRWVNATTAWNQAGGNLRDYRHMVVNHEVGHWLGHGHQNCPGAGQPAPVMQQQSINLQGCRFNPWPLDSELTSPTLGI